MVAPPARRQVVQHLQAHLAVSERRACRLVGIARATVQYQPRPDRNGWLRQTLRELATQRRRFGARRLYVLLRRAGHPVNHKRVERLYREEGLTLPRHRRKKRANPGRGGHPAGQRLDQQWTMDFLVDSLQTGRRFRVLTVVDTYSRQCLAIEADVSLTGQRVVQVLDRLAAQERLPEQIAVDNGPEFLSLVLDQWAEQHGVQLQFSRLGTPTDNAIIESFHGRLRDECLNEHLFRSLPETRQIIEAWRVDYNTCRPHSALNYQTPMEFIQQTQTIRLGENANFSLAE